MYMLKDFIRMAIIANSFVVCFVLASCADSNDEEMTPSLYTIIGTWKNIWGDDLRCDYSAYTFFEDGTGVNFDKGNGAVRFTYVYNPVTRGLTIHYSENEEDVYIIDNIASDYIVIEGVKYNKSDLTKNMLILGEWFLHVGDQEKATRVIFRYDGTYEAKDYDFDTYLLEEIHYSFSALSGIVTGTYSISENIISIKGESQISGDYFIDGLVVNGLRFIKTETPEAYPYLIGGYHDRNNTILH